VNVEFLMALEADVSSRAWMPELMRSSSTSLKRLEQVLAAARPPRSSVYATSPSTDAGTHGVRRRPRTD
jgi:hypothetical protein